MKTGRGICSGLLIVWATYHFSQLRIVLVAACLFASAVWAGETRTFSAPLAARPIVICHDGL